MPNNKKKSGKGRKTKAKNNTSSPPGAQPPATSSKPFKLPGLLNKLPPSSNAAAVSSSSAFAGWSNPSASTKEIVMRATIFSDSVASNTTQFKFSVSEGNQPFFNNDFRSQTVVRSAKLYALPQWDSDTSKSSLVVLWAIPVTYTEAQPDYSKKGTNTGQRSTLLTPTSVGNWALVGEYRASYFKDAVFFPIYVNEQDLQTYVVLGTAGLYEPDTGVLSTSTVQYRLDIEYSVTVPPQYNVYVNADPSTSADSFQSLVPPPVGGEVQTKPGYVQALRLENNV